MLPLWNSSCCAILARALLTSSGPDQGELLHEMVHVLCSHTLWRSILAKLRLASMHSNLLKLLKPYRLVSLVLVCVHSPAGG
jgi:hypothetical protein